MYSSIIQSLPLIQYKYLKAKIEFHHWWNNTQEGPDPDNDPKILTRRPKNMPLISLRNAEYAKHLAKMGYDDAQIEELGYLPQVNRLKRDYINERFQRAYLSKTIKRVFSVGRERENNNSLYAPIDLSLIKYPQSRKTNKVDLDRQSFDYRLNVVDLLDGTITTNNKDSTGMQPSTSTSMAHSILDVNSSVADEIEQQGIEGFDPEDDTGDGGTEDIYGENSPNNSVIVKKSAQYMKPSVVEKQSSSIFKFRSKKKKFIKTPPTDKISTNDNGGGKQQANIPGKLKRYKKVFVLSPARNLEFDIYDENLEEMPNQENLQQQVKPKSSNDNENLQNKSPTELLRLQKDIISNTRQRRASITSDSSSIRRHPFRINLLRRTSSFISDITRRPSSFSSTGTRTTIRVPSRDSIPPPSVPNDKLLSTIINDISLSAALQANGRRPLRINKKVTPGLENLNNYTRLFNKENNRSDIRRTESLTTDPSIESCINETIIIEPKPVPFREDDNKPLMVVLQSATSNDIFENPCDNNDGYHMSTIGYDSMIISSYQYSPVDNHSEEMRNTLTEALKLDPIEQMQKIQVIKDCRSAGFSHKNKK